MMSVDIPTAAVGSLSLNSPDDPEEYVSSNGGGSMTGSMIGSSVSKSDKDTVHISAEMAQNAMDVINQLQEKVYFTFIKYH